MWWWKRGCVPAGAAGASVLRQPVLVRVADRLGAVAGTGFVEDPVDVGLDGCVAEDELVCDLVLGSPGGDQLSTSTSRGVSSASAA